MKQYTISQRFAKLKKKLNKLPRGKFKDKGKWKNRRHKARNNGNFIPLMERLKINQNNICAHCPVRLRKDTRILYNETLICISCARKIIGGL